MKDIGTVLGEMRYPGRFFVIGQNLGDWEIIKAANEHGIALMATLERCFLH